MMENGFSSPRSDSFPAGLRVLVVDDDPTWLKILEKMLKKCSYDVTTCCLARDALKLLRERKDGYDIVISDVNMPDMDGFKLLEHVGLEMDLPVIMMSVDGETSRVMKGVQHGACDYLLKPIRMKELRNIWQHVFRKKIHEVRDIEMFEGMDSIQMARMGCDLSDDSHFLYGEDLTSIRKRKDLESKHDDKDSGENSSSKKARVVWSVDLHQKFVKAVNQIGFDKVGPKKILDLMNVPWLTRENVASHLQKYRLYLSRLQKDSNLKISGGGIKHSDSPSIESADISRGSYGFSGNSLLVQKTEPRNHENEQKEVVLKNTSEPKRGLIVDVPDPRKPRSSPIEFGHSFVHRSREVNFPVFDSNSPTQFSWGGIPQVEPKQEYEGYGSLPLPGANYTQPVPPVLCRSSVTETGIAGPVKVKSSSLGTTINSSHVQTSHGNLVGTTINSSHVQTSHGSLTGAKINSSHVLTSNGSHPARPGINSSLVQTGLASLVGPAINSSHGKSPAGTAINTSHGSSPTPIMINSGNVQTNHQIGPINSNHVQTKTYGPNHQTFEPILTNNTTSSMKSEGFNGNPNRIPDLESSQKFVTWGATPFGTLDDDMQFCLVQGDCYAVNFGLQNFEFPEYCDPGIIPEVPAHLYDTVRDYENPYDLSEYSLLEQGLFIT